MSAGVARCLLAGGLFFLLLASLCAEERSAAVAQLLDVGWSTRPNARAAADAQYAAAREVAGSERDAESAWLLVLMRQRRYEDALKQAEELLAKDPTDLAAHRARTWLATLAKNYPAAFVAADKLSEQLAATPPMSDAEQAAHDELIAFLGRIFGFLGGPAAGSVNQEERKEYERRVLDRIPASRKEAFELARDGVVQRYLELTGSKEDERDRAAEAAQAEKEKTLKEVDADREEIAARSKELDDQRQKVQSELKDELAEIAKQDRPLVQELARLDARARTLRRELVSYDFEISRLRTLADGTEDPAIRFRLLRDADRLALAASRLQADLGGVLSLADGVQAERAGLAGRQRQVQAAASQQVSRIDQELTGLAKRDKRNDGIARRASRTENASSGKALVLAAQAAALTTYEQFPLEAARHALLESLR